MGFYEFGRLCCLIFVKFFFKIEVVGKSNIDCELGSLILVSNHKSCFDPVFLGLGVKRQLFFMAKRELFLIPMLGFIIKKLGAFPVKRGSRDANAVVYAKSIINSGRILALFPEGTRSKGDEILKFKSGAVRLAITNNCKILPCSIFYSKGKFRRRVFLEFGKAITYRQLFEQKIDRVDLDNLSHKILVELSVKLRELIVKMNNSQKEKLLIKTGNL